MESLTKSGGALPEPRTTVQFDGYQERRLRRIADLCRGRSILDIGYAHKPNPFYRASHRVGLDLGRPVRPSGYEEEIVGDALDLGASLGARRFDSIVAGELIEHLENPYAFLRSLRGYLADDGRVILSTPNPVSWPVILFELFRSRRYFYSHDHLYYITPRWVVRLLEATGYVVEAIVPVGLLPPLGRFVLPCPVALSYQVIYVGRPTAA
jgi:SAM-dependent methyltransferase